MSQFNPGDEAIDPNATSGIDLADIINRLTGANITLNSGVSRPTYATLGTWWADTSDLSNILVYIFDGANDILVLTVDSVASTITLNIKSGIAVNAIAPTTPITGELWFDTNIGVNYLKVWNGSVWLRSVKAVVSEIELIPETSVAIDNMVEMTQADYDLLAPPDANTMYILRG